MIPNRAGAQSLSSILDKHQLQRKYRKQPKEQSRTGLVFILRLKQGSGKQEAGKRVD